MSQNLLSITDSVKGTLNEPTHIFNDAYVMYMAEDASNPVFGRLYVWMEDNKLHKSSGPSITVDDLYGDVRKNFHEEWYDHGLLSRDEGPAVITPYFQEYWQNGKFIRREYPNPYYYDTGVDTYEVHIDANDDNYCTLNDYIAGCKLKISK